MQTVTQILMRLCRVAEEKLNAEANSNRSAIAEDVDGELPLENRSVNRGGSLPKAKNDRTSGTAKKGSEE